MTMGTIIDALKSASNLFSEEPEGQQILLVTILTILTFIATFIEKVFNLVNQHRTTNNDERKIDADAVNIATQANKALMEPLIERVNELESSVSTMRDKINDYEGRCNALECKIYELKRGIKILLGQLRDNNITPLWILEDDTTEEKKKEEDNA